MKIYLNEKYEIKKIDDVNFGKGNNLYNFIEVWLFKSSVDKDNTLPSFSFKMGDFVFGQFIHNETRNDGDYLIFNFKIPDYILFEQGKLIITISINFFNSNGIIVKNKNITVQGNVLDAVILNGDMIALSNDIDQLAGSIRKNIDQLNKRYDSTALASSVYTKTEVNSLLSEKVNRNEIIPTQEIDSKFQELYYEQGQIRNDIFHENVLNGEENIDGLFIKNENGSIGLIAKYRPQVKINNIPHYMSYLDDLDSKADKSNTYTKNESDTRMEEIFEMMVDEGALDNYVTNQVFDYQINYLENSLNKKIADLNVEKLNIKIVNTLPTENISTTTIYLINSITPESGNVYDEYVYVNNNWEKIGSMNFISSDYYTKTESDVKFLEKTSINTGLLNAIFENVTTKNLELSYMAGDGTKKTGKVKSDLTPYEDVTYQLGSSSKAWNRIYLSAGDPIKIRTTIPNSNKPGDFLSISPFDVDIFNNSMSINYANELNYKAIKIYPNNIQFKSLDGEKMLDIDKTSVKMLSVYDDMGNRRDTVHIEAGTRFKLSTSDSYIGAKDFNIIPYVTADIAKYIDLANLDRIKFGGMEVTRRSQETNQLITEEIMMGFKPANSAGEIIPFAITKSGRAYYQGMDLFELHKNSVLYDRKDYEIIGVDLSNEQLPVIKNKKWYLITGLPNTSSLPENEFLYLKFPEPITIEKDFDIIIDFSNFNYSQGGNYYYIIEFDAKYIAANDNIVNGIDFLFSNEYIKSNASFGPDYFQFTMKESKKNGIIIRLVKIGKFLYVTEPYYEQ